MMEFNVTAVRPDVHGNLALLHVNVRKYGTVFNTVKAGVEISGSLNRKRTST